MQTQTPPTDKRNISQDFKINFSSFYLVFGCVWFMIHETARIYAMHTQSDQQLSLKNMYLFPASCCDKSGKSIIESFWKTLFYAIVQQQQTSSKRNMSWLKKSAKAVTKKVVCISLHLKWYMWINKLRHKCVHKTSWIENGMGTVSA